MANLPPDLEAYRKQIEAVAKSMGLDFFDTIFEIISYDKINEIAAYGGFPKRYPHWKFGMDYEKMSKSYEFGLSKIYEMVINTDPCYAYLMEGNSKMDQKLVMAHVFGHCDFFKNNIWFSKTDRKMVDTMANHGVRVQRYIDRYGLNRVETFIDQCLSLENLIDRYGIFSPPKQSNIIQPKPNFSFKTENSYMDKYINPPKAIAEQERKYNEEQLLKNKYPVDPEKDILYFLMGHAPLEDWEQDILSIIRSEAYYFSPQGLTKTLNEGFASYWHSKILTSKILDDSEIIEFASKHAGVMGMAPGGYNPYKVGIELLRDIEYRYDNGQFGREWNACDNLKEKTNWKKKTNQGRDKIFEVRKIHNDVSFLSEFLTEDFCRQQKMFVYKYDKNENKFVIDTTDFKQIKNQLLFQLSNFGQPIIWVENANFENRGELLLKHLHEGQDLQPKFMGETLSNLYKIWRRPVAIHTVMKDEEQVFRFDGEKMSSLQYEKK